MFCKNCGTQLDEGTRFCTECGSPVGQTAPVPKAPKQPVPVQKTQPKPAAPAPGPAQQVPAQITQAIQAVKARVIKLAKGTNKKTASLIGIAAVAAIALLVFFINHNAAAQTNAAQESPDTVYVSARGNAGNSGMRENQPTTFARALEKAYAGTVEKIIVIGTLDMNSGYMSDTAVFNVDVPFHDYKSIEFTITGKPNASNAQRAVLSAKGSGRNVLRVAGDSTVNVILEHIELSGGEGEQGHGLAVMDGAWATLGTGAVIQGNAGAGISVTNMSICFMEGGEVRNNSGGVKLNSAVFWFYEGSISDNTVDDHGAGVSVGEGGKLYMKGGTIANNRTGTSDFYSGGGVYVDTGGEFTMSGGSITNNTAHDAGGGVAVLPGVWFELEGGSITNNTAQFFGGGIAIAPGGHLNWGGGTVSGNTAQQYADIYEMSTIAATPAAPQAPAAQQAAPQQNATPAQATSPSADARAATNRGIAAYNQGNYDQAITEYTEALRIYPNYAIAYQNRGLAYRQKNDYDRAISDYTNAIRLDPNYTTAYYNRGVAYYQKNDYDRAITDYNNAIRLNPNYTSAYFNRGSAYYQKKDYDRAITDYEAVLRLDPNHANARTWLANAQQARGTQPTPAPAPAQNNQALADAAFNRGATAFNQGNYDRAVTELTEAIRLSPNDFSSYFNRGLAYYNLNNYDNAISDLTNAIRLDPNYANAYVRRGIAYYDRGMANRSRDDLNRASADADTALQLEPNNERAGWLRVTVRGRLSMLNPWI